MAIDPVSQKAVDRALADGFSPGDDVKQILAGLVGSLAGSLTPGGVTAQYVATTTDPGFSQFRSTTLGSTPVVIKPSAGNLYFWSATNLLNAVIWIKIYNTATPTPGTTPVAFRFQVPANGQVIDRNALVPLHFSTAMSAIATIVGADTGTQTAPGTLPAIELLYK